MKSKRSFVCSIVPPHILQKLLESKEPEVRRAAIVTLVTTASLRAERHLRAAFAGAAIEAPAQGRRTVYDCQRRRVLSTAVQSRSEPDGPSQDQTVNRAFDGLGATRTFFQQVHERNSIDNRGMRLDAYVHFSSGYNNAFWNGQVMVFGDGDGRVFTDFTKSLDVIAHELSHGVTEHTAGLEYHNQSGALNESMSDVFGSLVKQHAKGETADQADWLIGADVFTPEIEADALRSLKAPGQAYDNDEFGKDPQPDHMSRFARLPDTEEGDFGGVHVNSGIPNKAFYLAATNIGGQAWEAPGHIWYESLKASGSDTEFQEFADTTVLKAGQLYGANSDQQKAVVSAWAEVGIRVGVAPTAIVSQPADAMEVWTERMVVLSRQIQSLSGELAALKPVEAERLLQPRKAPSVASRRR